MCHDCDAVPDNSRAFPEGKSKMRWLSDTIELYEPHPMDYFVIPVARVVGQAFLMPNFETPTIPYYMKEFKKRAFPWGKNDSNNKPSGSRLWVVNHHSMLAGRSICD